MCCGAAVGAVLLLDVAAAGSDGREWIAYVVSLKLSVLSVSIRFSATLYSVFSKETYCLGSG